MDVAHPNEADVAEMLAVAQASDRAAYGDTDWTEDELRRYLEDVDPQTDVWVVRLDGRLAGWASVEARRGGRVVGDGYVEPALFGHGVGAKLLDLTEERARELEGATSLENATLNQDERTRALYASRGYREARWFWRMVLHMDAPPVAPTVPAGIDIAPFDVETMPQVADALNDAFSEEWGWVPLPLEDFTERRADPSRFRDDLSFTAWAGNEVAGILHGAWKSHGDWGFIPNVGVRRAWRGRGLGQALLHTSFGRFWQLGERTVALGVDAHNPTGATRLYERVGMRRLWEAVLWQKALQ